MKARSASGYDAVLGHGPTRAVPRVPAAAVARDPEGFYATVARGPVVVTQALPADPLVQGLTVVSVASMLHGGVVEAYATATGEREAVPAADFFRDLLAGRGRHNVVDHPLVGTPLEGRVHTPAFMGTNWLPADRTDLGISPVSLTLSPAGNFTPLHIDAYGMQGWMLLLEGRKRWWFIDAEQALPTLDPVTGGVPENDPARWQGVTRWVTEVARGDMVYVPPGWAHQVLTLEVSLGLGGSVINEHPIVAGMISWLAERSVGVSDELDVAALVRAHASEVTGANGRQRVARALAMHQGWASGYPPSLHPQR